MIKHIKSDDVLLHQAHIIEDELERIVVGARKALDASVDCVALLKGDFFDNPANY